MPSGSSEPIESKYGRFKIQKMIKEKHKISEEIIVSLVENDPQFKKLMEELFNSTFEECYDRHSAKRIQTVAEELIRIYDANVTNGYSLEGFHNYIHNSLLSLGCNSMILCEALANLDEAVEKRIITNIDEYDAKYNIILDITDQLKNEEFKTFMKLRNEDMREEFIKTLSI